MELDDIADNMLCRVQRGEIADSDAALVTAFAMFLRETPEGLMRHLGDAPDYFPDRVAFEDWRARWLPFLLGYHDGPATPEEYADLRPKIFRTHPDIDSFHT